MSEKKRGYATGGYTGRSMGDNLQPAGIVHPGTYFIPRETLEKLAVDINAPTAGGLRDAIVQDGVLIARAETDRFPSPFEAAKRRFQEGQQ